MRLLRRFVFHNALYKFVALLVACVLWAAVQGSRSIESSLDVPIDLREIPESLVVVDQSASEINVRILGSRAAVRRAEKQFTTYPVSLEGVKPGPAQFAVNTERLDPPRGARIVARSPSTIVLQIEEVLRKKVRVRADVVGTPPPGYKLLGVSVVPSEVLLAGARGSMRRLREVLTDRVDVSQMRETTTVEVPLAFSGSHVWRAEEDGSPIRVEVRLEAPPAEEAPAEGEAGGARSDAA